MMSNSDPRDRFVCSYLTLIAMRFIVLYLVLLVTLCSCICSLGLDELIILFSLFIFVWTCEVLFLQYKRITNLFVIYSGSSLLAWWQRFKNSVQESTNRF